MRVDGLSPRSARIVTTVPGGRDAMLASASGAPQWRAVDGNEDIAGLYACLLGGTADVEV